MSSRFRLEVSTTVKELLEQLAGDNPPGARELALLLLRLEREPEPPHSRALEPTLVDALPGARIWERPDWTILYFVDPEISSIVIGSVKRGR